MLKNINLIDLLRTLDGDSMVVLDIEDKGPERPHTVDSLIIDCIRRDYGASTVFSIEPHVDDIGEAYLFVHLSCRCGFIDWSE